MGQLRLIVSNRVFVKELRAEDRFVFCDDNGNIRIDSYAAIHGLIEQMVPPIEDNEGTPF